MNPKYTPATYFGAFFFVLTLIIIQSVKPGAFNSHTIIFLLPAAVLSGVFGGWIFGIVWNKYKKGQKPS